MAQFRVKFLKTVCGDTGHEVEICQRVLDVEAANEEAAVEMAKPRFSRLENIDNWSLHADRVQVENAQPSAPKPLRAGKSRKPVARSAARHR